jgi:hypothetical protein
VISLREDNNNTITLIAPRAVNTPATRLKRFKNPKKKPLSELKGFLNFWGG